MAEVWKPQPIEVYKDWVSVLRTEVSEELTRWETDFVMSIGYQLDNGRILSQKQADILERIYAEKTK